MNSTFERRSGFLKKYDTLRVSNLKEAASPAELEKSVDADEVTARGADTKNGLSAPPAPTSQQPQQQGQRGPRSGLGSCGRIITYPLKM